MSSLRGTLARLLIANLLAPAPMAAAAPANGDQARPAYQSTELQGDQRILQALNRFTFGPRPGDLEAVRSMGLENWFEQQVHPASIDETDLNARLAQFPAMQWSARDLLYRVPSNPQIRQAMNGRLQVPENPTLHAVYEDAIYRLQMRQEAKNEKSSAAPQPAAGQPAMNGNPAPVANDMPLPDPQAMALAARIDALDGPAPEPAEVSAVLALPPDRRIEKLIGMQPEEFASFTRELRPVERLELAADLAPGQRETLEDLENPERLVAGELMAERLTRDIYSNAQLQEVMTDFWLNHFNIYLRKNEMMPYYLVSYARDTIRPHALGKFEDLLEAVAHSPAMLIYLDNAESIGPDSVAARRAEMTAFRRPGAKEKAPEGLNENYARELMELHTLGVNGGYTQADVIQVARVLTGWTVDRPGMGGGFQFAPMRHEPGTKKVMGKKIKDGGEREGEELLHMLASSPATAHFLSRELAIRFVSDDPPPALVDRMAKAYLASGGDIPAVLRTLFRSPEFWQASDFRAKVKTPLEFVVSAARASNADVQNYQPLINTLRQMGMPLYGCIPPSGYAWDAETWVSTASLVDRMNFALALASNRFPGIRVDWNRETNDANAEASGADPMPSAEQEEARLEPLLIPGGVSVSTRSAALQQFAAQAGQPPAQNEPRARALPAARFMNRPNAKAAATSPLERRDQLLAGLLLGSPEFQRR